MIQFLINLVTCSVVITALSMMFILISKPLRKLQSPKWRYYSWLLILIGFFTPFKPSFGSPMIEIDMSAPASDLSAADLKIQQLICTVLFAAWISGVMMVIIRTLVRQLSFTRSVSRLGKPAGKWITNIAELVADEIGISAEIKVVIFSEISSPMIVGFLIPAILLPDRGFADDELRLILKHELTHFKHHDLYFKVFMIICRAIHWFNPLMPLITRNIEQECELYCDENVIKDENSYARKLYCQSILSTVLVRNRNVLVPAIASNFYNGRQGLKNRMQIILFTGKKYRLGIICATVLVLTALSGTILAFSGDEGNTSEIIEYETATATFVVWYDQAEEVLVSATGTTAIEVVIPENLISTTVVTAPNNFPQ